jgi:hypothetical protein
VPTTSLVKVVAMDDTGGAGGACELVVTVVKVGSRIAFPVPVGDIGTGIGLRSSSVVVPAASVVCLEVDWKRDPKGHD